MRQRFLLVHNATAGWRGTSRLQRTISALRARGADITIATTATLDDLHLACRHLEAFDALIVAGGDGTVRAVAPYVAAARIPLGLIALGTGNVLANELGLPRQPEALADLLVSASTVQVYGGLVEDRPFYLMVGIGFDGHVVAGLDTRLKRRAGQLAYVPRTFSALSRKPAPLTLDVDGIEHKADWAVIANARTYGSRFRLTRSGGVCEPGLVAVLVEAPTRRALAARLLALAGGQLERMPRVRSIACHAVRVTSGMPVPVQADGDSIGTTPVRITANGPRLQIIAPSHED